MSKPTIFQVTKSVLSAFVGIQTNDNRKRDFTEGSVAAYIVVGAVITVVFIISLVFVVSLITGS